MGALVTKTEPAPIRACTVSRDIQKFEFLIDDMELALGESWGDLSFDDMLVFLDQPEAQALEFLVVAVSNEDMADIELIEAVVAEAQSRDLGVILVAADLEPGLLHQLMRAGAREFLPYPVPETALEDSIARLQAPTITPQVDRSNGNNDASNGSTLIAVHPMAGGVGATTFAVNLAWELANQKKDPPSVAILDLDLQFGEVATYLDLARRGAIYELMSDLEGADEDSLKQAMLEFKDRLHVLTAPLDMLPLDLITQQDVEKLLSLARAQFDFIIVDMPRTLVAWTETVLIEADCYFPIVELDMRSAQNTLRFIKTLSAEDLPVEKLRFLVNRAPKFTDLNGRGRLKRMSESLDIELNDLMPDGAATVTEASDQGLPIGEVAAKNPMRKEIARIAKQFIDAHKGARSAKR